MIKLVVMTSIYIAVMGSLLFGAAGRLDWPMAWAYLVILTISTVALLVFGDRQMLLVRAGKEKGAKTWDQFLANLSFILFWPGSCVIAGLDYGRLHFSPSIPLPVRLIAILAFAFGLAFAVWAMLANKFFVKFVKIQTDREHTVITNGPYAYVRHPGYAGSLLAFISLPVALGSLLALLPASAGLSLWVLRTYLEDRTLQKELDGYSQYVSRVRWRLIPGIW
ncbi:MAG: isoprenylcysteine carboxylmethyltransferase family protein [Planctomycetes bacterium]|nr:isoprenylcysteine carboxylmethyltransferase family protein [Planctomycetota bacterium]